MDGKPSPKTVSDVFQIVDIALDSYDDIFSDFDPSPYATRILSEDFLNELFRRYSRTGKGRVVVNFTIPRAMRSEKTETLIRKRLKDHFKERDRLWEGRIKERIRIGLARLAIGAAISAAILIFPDLDVVPVITLLSVLVWYFMWTGFDSLIEVPMRLRRKKDRADRYLMADYNFLSQEDVLISMQKLQEPGAEAAKKEPGAKAEAPAPRPEAKKEGAEEKRPEAKVEQKGEQKK